MCVCADDGIRYRAVCQTIEVDEGYRIKLFECKSNIVRQHKGEKSEKEVRVHPLKVGKKIHQNPSYPVSNERRYAVDHKYAWRIIFNKPMYKPLCESHWIWFWKHVKFYILLIHLNNKTTDIYYPPTYTIPVYLFLCTNTTYFLSLLQFGINMCFFNCTMSFSKCLI